MQSLTLRNYFLNFHQSLGADGLSYLITILTVVLFVFSLLTVGRKSAISYLKNLIFFNFTFLFLHLFLTKNVHVAIRGLSEASLSSIVGLMVILIVGQFYKSYDLERLQGLYRKNKFLAISFCIAILSLVGLPPFIGGHQKYFVSRLLFSDNLALLVFVAISWIITILSGVMTIKLTVFNPPTEFEEQKITFKHRPLQFLYIGVVLIFISFFNILGQFLNIGQIWD